MTRPVRLPWLAAVGGLLAALGAAPGSSLAEEAAPPAEETQRPTGMGTRLQPLELLGHAAGARMEACPANSFGSNLKQGSGMCLRGRAMVGPVLAAEHVIRISNFAVGEVRAQFSDRGERFMQPVLDHFTGLYGDPDPRSPAGTSVWVRGGVVLAVNVTLGLVVLRDIEGVKRDEARLRQLNSWKIAQ